MTTSPAQAATPQQLATMQAIADGSRPVWVIVYPDGDWCCMRDGQRAVQHARDSHGLLIEYQPRRAD